jgi:hypothetical protein
MLTLYNSYYSACMKSSEKIGKVWAEFNVKYETVQGLTYKKKKRSSSNFQWIPATISLQYTLCKHMYRLPCDCTILWTADIRQLWCSHWVSNTGAKSEALITKLQAAGSIISLQWIRQTYTMLSYQPVKLYNDVLINCNVKAKVNTW